MRVLLVDDNRLMLEGLQNLLEAYKIQVVGTATDGAKAVSLSKELRPDVILMDIRMPGVDGLAATRLIKAGNTDARIVILTTSNEEETLFEAVKSGASGYLVKSIDAEKLVEALEQLMEGIPPFSPGLAARLLDEFTRISNTPTPRSKLDGTPKTTLSPRQIEVLKLVAEGLSYKEVGAKLNISPRTVKYHIAEIMNALHLENRAQVIAFAGRLGLKKDQSETQ